MDLVFECKKCTHHLFVDFEPELKEILIRLPEYSCPSCGEDGHLNWIFSHVGSYEDEQENYRQIK